MLSFVTSACMSVTDHHEYHKFKCMLAEQDALNNHGLD